MAGDDWRGGEGLGCKGGGQETGCCGTGKPKEGLLGWADERISTAVFDTTGGHRGT